MNYLHLFLYTQVEIAKWMAFRILKGGMESFQMMDIFLKDFWLLCKSGQEPISKNFIGSWDAVHCGLKYTYQRVTHLRRQRMGQGSCLAKPVLIETETKTGQDIKGISSDTYQLQVL